MWSSLLEIRVSLPSDGGAATRSGTRLSRETDVILTSEHALLLFWHDPSDHYVRAARTLLQSSNYFEIVWHFYFYRFKNKDLIFRQTILMHSVHKLLLINVLLITYFFKGNLSFKMLKVRVCIQDFRLKSFLISLLLLVVWYHLELFQKRSWSNLLDKLTRWWIEQVKRIRANILSSWRQTDRFFVCLALPSGAYLWLKCFRKKQFSDQFAQVIFIATFISQATLKNICFKYII